MDAQASRQLGKRNRLGVRGRLVAGIALNVAQILRGDIIAEQVAQTQASPALRRQIQGDAIELIIPHC